MILLSSALRIYVTMEPVNMRRSFDGLMAQVRSRARTRSTQRPCLRLRQSQTQPNEALDVDPPCCCGRSAVRRSLFSKASAMVSY